MCLLNKWLEQRQTLLIIQLQKQTVLGQICKAAAQKL